MDYLRIVDQIFNQFKSVSFTIKTWDGKKKKYGKGSSKFTVEFANEKALKKLLSLGSLGFGESYMSGDIKIKGDLDAYLKLRHNASKIRRTPQIILAKLLSDMSVINSKDKQISYHYDLGNEFFKTFLDSETMTYSCGYYIAPKDTLEKSQMQKYELLANWLNLGKNSTVLDLGFGWGGMAIHIAKKYRSRVTGLTLSRKQLEYSKELVSTTKLESLINFKYQDMLDLPKKKFDAVIILESIEHVGKENLKKFFSDLSDTVKPGGSLVIQTTGRYIPKRVDRWTLKYVFPGGYLPSQEELLRYSIENGFVLEEFVDDTNDYAKTLSFWIANLEKNEKKIKEMFDPSFFNLWQLYLHGARVAFRVRSMGLFRMKLRKI